MNSTARWVRRRTGLALSAATAAAAAVVVHLLPAAAADPLPPATSPATQPSAATGPGAATAPAAPAGTAASGPPPSPDVRRADAEIRFWSARANRDPHDHLTPTKLGWLLLLQARRTGDPAYHAKAEQALRTALARHPAHAPALAALAAVHIARHRFADAVAAARQAAEINPSDPDVAAALGDALLEAGDLAAAEALYAKLAADLPGLASHGRLGNLRRARGDLPAAAAAFTEALKSGRAAGAPAEDLAWCLVQLGEVCFARGNWAAAEAHYAEAARLTPYGHAPAEHLGELWAAQKRHDEAVAAYREVAAAVPRPEYFHALGDVLAAAGQSAEARAWHDKALRGYLAAAADENAHYYHHLAGYYADVAKDGAEAVRWARRDVPLRRTTATLDALAWALHADGKPAEAAAAMDEALTRGAGDAHVLYHASLIYFRAGDPAKGRDCLTRAAAVNPKFNEFHVHR